MRRRFSSIFLRPAYSQRSSAVEGFSIVALSYYLLGIVKTALEALYHSGAHVSLLAMLVSIPIVLGTVSLAIVRVKRALETID